MRYFFEISYNGTAYHGWQNQANAVGVQEVVESALSKIFRTKIEIVGSGRTDAGVHCAQQFFHADLDKEIDEPTWLIKLNSLLPKDIAIRTIRPVKAEAHARYDAFERSYEYKITRVKDPLLIGQAYYFFKSLDVANMNRAAALLVGEHDFECFSKVKTDVNHFICTVKKVHWNQKGDLLVLNITANRFLRGMVRAIVGTLLDVGCGKISLEDFNGILKGKDRKKAGMNVPPEGLYLTSVKYHKKIFLN
ncbi:MAG: tRNA pseudouridine(38-40) synthase TruA [Cytophagales bacterium]|nr:tRNA pseudouridine(38-40) synthase TruA [Cytophagales bacterium]MCA6387245.1 tRNA pseudouridine(38-40) synthase TruA [Cytophagales bacterium]MCA6392637.1 tRNA pseudouridine(38-40) synthase TruA [Cytophagales bacterium]MCA6395797.1 tRNA pseudouridine(38-40) synthase TruA [Cytophagales bacterium]MCA6398737.1 tRNA pseudouridine(38-40) synthase TruA [Cytophagales bacterium]